MAKTYLTAWGNKGSVTRRGGNDGVHVACQSYDGSIIVENWYDGETLKVRVDTAERSSCYGDSYHCFTGTLEEFNNLLKLHKEIKEGKVSVVRHREKSNKQLQLERAFAEVK